MQLNILVMNWHDKKKRDLKENSTCGSKEQRE